MTTVTEYDYIKCVDFLTYFLAMAVSVSRGEEMSALNKKSEYRQLHEISAMKTFVKGPLFEFYGDLLGVSFGAVEIIREYSEEKIECWQIGLEIMPEFCGLPA